ncbi:hypothetical protein ACHAQA_000567 [Verticillium albo-atrum]
MRFTPIILSAALASASVIPADVHNEDGKLVERSTTGEKVWVPVWRGKICEGQAKCGQEAAKPTKPEKEHTDGYEEYYWIEHIDRKHRHKDNGHRDYYYKDHDHNKPKHHHHQQHDKVKKVINKRADLSGEFALEAEEDLVKRTVTGLTSSPTMRTTQTTSRTSSRSLTQSPRALITLTTITVLITGTTMAPSTGIITVPSTGIPITTITMVTTTGATLTMAIMAIMATIMGATTTTRTIGSPSLPLTPGKKHDDRDDVQWYREEIVHEHAEDRHEGRNRDHCVHCHKHHDKHHHHHRKHRKTPVVTNGSKNSGKTAGTTVASTSGSTSSTGRDTSSSGSKTDTKAATGRDGKLSNGGRTVNNKSGNIIKSDGNKKTVEVTPPDEEEEEEEEEEEDEEEDDE